MEWSVFIADLFVITNYKNMPKTPKTREEKCKGWMVACTKGHSDWCDGCFKSCPDCQSSSVYLHGQNGHICTVGCPYYLSGHSIDADGNCNKGCC